MRGTLLLVLPVIIIALPFTDANATTTAKTSLECWQCQNGYKASKECEGGPTKVTTDSGSGDGAEVSLVTYNYPARKQQPPPNNPPPDPNNAGATNNEEAPKQDTAERSDSSAPVSNEAKFRANQEAAKSSGCKGVEPFFIKYSTVLGEWNKRTLGKSKGRSNGQPEAFCVSIMSFGTNHVTTALVYRGCVSGTRQEIKDGFSYFLEVKDLKLEGESVDECVFKDVGSESGTKKIKVCVCNNNKCNTQTYSGIARNIPSLTYLIFSSIVAFIPYYY